MCLATYLSVLGFRHWRVWGEGCAYPLLLQLSGRYNHASSLRNCHFCWLVPFRYNGLDNWAMNNSFLRPDKGLCGRQPGYSRHSPRMVLQVGPLWSSLIIFLRQGGQFRAAAYWIRAGKSHMVISSWRERTWKDLSPYLPGRRSSLSLVWRAFLGTRAW